MPTPLSELPQSQQRVEALLVELRAGDQRALSDLFGLLYEELSASPTGNAARSARR